MHRFVYVSTAARPLSAQQIADFAGACHRNDRRAGLTGLLVVHQGRVLHILEGDEAAIQRRVQKLQDDVRLTEMEVLQSREVKMRAFVDWTFVHETPATLPFMGGACGMPLRALMPINSPLRGRDLTVRHMVRDFLASFKQLLAA